MSRRTNQYREPARAPLQQPPLFYRDGKALSDAERFGTPPAAPPEPVASLNLDLPPPRPVPVLRILAMQSLAAVMAIAKIVAVGALVITGIGLGVAFGKNRQ